MLCAHVHDQTVAEDYYRAMDRIEKSTVPANTPADGAESD